VVPARFRRVARASHGPVRGGSGARRAPPLRPSTRFRPALLRVRPSVNDDGGSTVYIGGGVIALIIIILLLIWLL
jgi:hypothetical protein